MDESDAYPKVEDCEPKDRVSEVHVETLTSQFPIPFVGAPTLAELGGLLRGLSALTGHADEYDTLDAALMLLRRQLRGRHMIIRSIDSTTSRVDLVRSTAPLRDGSALRLRVSRAAVQRLNVDEESLLQSAITVVDEYACDLVHGNCGVDSLLLSDGKVFGVMAWEYRAASCVDEQEPCLLDIVAGAVAGALARVRERKATARLGGYLNRLFEQASLPIAVFDPAQRLQVASRAMLSLLHAEREDAIGQDVFTVFPKLDAESHAAILRTMRGERARSTIELAVREPARVAIDFVVIRSAHDDVEGTLAIARDVTELRALESQVLQAEKLATLGQLAAGIVHELNNPLTSISVYADYLMKKGAAGAFASDDVEKLRRILVSAERVQKFTRDLVTYARPSSEESRWLPIDDIVRQALVFCEHVIAEHGAAVSVVVEPDLPPVLAVRGQLHQVFINLITNACHAMPQGAGRLEVAISRREGGVLVAVRDNGSGVAPEHLSSIFEPFFSTKGEGKGTGLGLSIVRKIVDHHGGWIRVSSVWSSGAEFSVWLPARNRAVSGGHPVLR